MNSIRGPLARTYPPPGRCLKLVASLGLLATLLAPPPTFAVPPVAVDNGYGVDEDTALNVAAPGVLGNDSDADLDPLTAQLVSGPSSGSLNGSFAADGSFTYTPGANFSGVDSFTYRAIAGGEPSNDATVTITVNPVNDPPTAVDDSFSNIGEDSSDNTLNVLTNDTDPDIGDNRRITAVTAPSNGGNVNIVGGGPNNTLRYSPALNFFGTETFTYTMRDAAGLTDTALVTITVVPADDQPTFTSVPPLSATQDQLYTYNITAQDVDGDPLVITAPIRPAWLNSFADNGNGTATLSGTPSAADIGDHNVTLRVSDGTPPLVPQSFVVTVENVNDPPDAIDDAFNVDEDSADNTLDVLANDTDPDIGDTKRIAEVTTPDNGGTVTIFGGGPDNVLRYSPAPDFIGTETFSYTMRDTAGLTDTAVVTVTVDAVNDAPVANPDAYVTAEDTILNVPVPGVLANDTDEEGGALTAQLATGTSSGTLILNANGSFSYTPNENFFGVDSFTYLAVDDAVPPAQSAPATVTITVTGVNDPPVATPDAYTTSEDTTVSRIAAQGVLANDVDPDSVMTAVLVAPPTNGTVVLEANGSFSYTPALNYFGPDSFTYQAIDDGVPPLQSTATTVAIDVTPVNDPPAGTVPDQNGTENVAILLELAPLFTEPDNENDDPFSFQISGLPDGLVGSAAGLISGTPALVTSVGDSTVQVTVQDSLGAAFQTEFTLRVLMAGRADLSLSITASPGPALISQAVGWSFLVDNRSNENVGNITLDAVFSGQVPFTLTDAPGCSVTPQGGETEISCVAGPVSANASTTVTVTGSSTQAGDVLAEASISIADPVPIDETPDNDSATGALNVAQRLSAAPAQKLANPGLTNIAGGDLNGDGFPDLAAVTGAGQGILVHPNVLDPDDPNGFKRALADQPLTFGSAAQGTDIAIADFDGDGAPDIVAANGAAQPSHIMINQNLGDGSFGFDPSPIELGPGADLSNAVAAADVNGDQLPDVVFGNASPNRLFLNLGGATFSELGIQGDTGAETVDVVLVDLFGDGLPELVVANADRDSEVYRNDNGTLQKELDIATGPATSIAAADFDGDGDADLVFGRSASQDGVPSNLLYLNTSMGGPGMLFPAGGLGASPTTHVLTLDIDDDLDTDIVSINATGGHQIFTNDGNGQFSLHPELFASAGPLGAVAGRFSVDDRVDVAVAGTIGSDLFFNDGLGNLGPGDIDIPVIQRTGPAAVELIVEEPYVDPGATAFDGIDGDLSDRIVIDNPVDTAVIGRYTITYNVADTSGNSAVTVTRTVSVAARTGTGGGGGGRADRWLVGLLSVLCLLRVRWRHRLWRES